MLIPTLTGLLTALAVVVTVLVQRTTPSHSRCPACSGVTSAVAPAGRAWILAARKLTWRWCTGCGWEGAGRKGPGLRGGGPVSHDSGFHWGHDRMPADFGFQWSADPTPRRPPSGFQWNADSTPRQPPSGFQWASTSTPPEVEAAHPSGFTFASSPHRVPAAIPRPSEFRFRADGTSADPASAFRWSHRQA